MLILVLDQTEGRPLSTRFQALVEELRAATNAHRVTLRQDVPGEYAFPVTHEALAAGVASLKDFTDLDQLDSPTFGRILRERSTVVQNDCRAAANGADAEFAGEYHRRLIDLYGGMAAFITAPVWIGDRLVGAISVHELDGPRNWTSDEVERTKAAAEQVSHALVSNEGGSTLLSDYTGVEEHTG